MGQPFLIRRRQQLSCLSVIAFIFLSLSTPTTCASEFSAQDVSHNKHTLSTTDRIANNSQEALKNYKHDTKYTSLYKNTTSSFIETSTKSIQSIGQVPAINNLPVESNSNVILSLSSGLTLLNIISSVTHNCWKKDDVMKCVRDTLTRLMGSVLHSSDSYPVSRNVQDNEVENNDLLNSGALYNEEKITALQETILKQLRHYEASMNLGRFGNEMEDSARNLLSWFKPEGSGKSSFLTGFGLGFLAFGLKKLLLPIFIGAQIVKSVLIAMFLPSILGGLGKLVGKGVSTFASASGSSGPSNNNVDDFEFKDNVGFDSADSATAASKYSSSFTYPETNVGLAYENGLSAGTLPAAALYLPGTATGVGSFNRFQQQATGNSKVSYESLPTGAQHHYGSYYTRHQQPNKKQDYKVFHNIPSSSLLLTNYDPFYSPLLSRLDSVFKQLGYETETCRERLVCAMYNNPAKFAPYSNLVSAQLSRELNELRKPSTDNPEILRFFRYMKAAKDGQDGADCIHLHPGCTSSSAHSNVHPPMIKTYQDINKLVQARRMGKSLGV